MQHYLFYFINRIGGRLFLLLSACFCVMTAGAQTGTIRGVIKDSTFGETIPGAVVRIDGAANQGKAADIDGNFEFSQVAPGTYTLIVNAVSYKALRLEDVKVIPGKVTELELSLGQATKEIEEVVISATRASGSQKAVIAEIRQSHQVVSGISSEQIRTSQDRDAAQVMSRVPGITIVENRFVMVRGVPERYNQVLLNNVIAPSTEIDRRTFSFDLIPSSVLDRMMVYKSGTAENVGDFAGGLIKIYTRNAVEDDFTSVSISTGYRSGTTGNNFLNAPGGSATDYFGFDNSRGLPASFPETEAMKAASRRSELRNEAGKSMTNAFVPQQTTALPNLGASVSAGRRWGLGGGKSLSMITALNYSQSYQYYVRDFHRYFTWQPEDIDQDRPIHPWFNYNDHTYEKENRVGLITNWQLKLNAFNRIDFRNLVNQIGENTTIIREGEEFQQYAGLPRRNYMMGYRGRTIYNGQLEGTHHLTQSNTTLNWVLGANYLGESEPDLRRFRTFKPANEDVYQLILPPSSNLFDAGRYFGQLKETGGHHALNIDKRLGGTEERPFTVKAGYLADYRQRTFSARYFSYLYPGQNDPTVGEDIKRMPLDQVFSPENIKTENGLTIEEGTRTIDQYDASNFLAAGYVHGLIPVGNFNINAGLRMEYNVQELNSTNDAGAPLEVHNPVWSPLGFLNVDYLINDKMQLRFAYGRTVNRPEFRELAPFMFYDFKMDASKVGNPNLKTAYVNNFDFRYELYPREGETYSIGAFYKNFINPIETQIFVMTEQPGLGFLNAESAYNYGAELEVRKSLKGVTGSRFIDRFSVNVNASLIRSEVSYGDSVARAQDSKRPLQGQSPYIINAGLYYRDENAGLQFSAGYNIFGSRIYAVGSYLFPTIYEMPRHALDLTVSKKFGKHIALKFGIQDVLNARYRFYQDSDVNGVADAKKDHPIFTYKRGSLYTMTFTYDF